MSIAEMQACLARLYVNEPFRKWFYLDPPAALDGYSLTREESDALKKIDRDKLDRFASSLVNKRRKKVERAFPALFALDRAAMRRYYARFYQLHPARLDHAYYQDVIDFGTFIEESLARTEHIAPYASDLARYERLYYLASMATVSSGGPADLVPAEATSGDATTPDARPVLGRDVQVADFTYDVGQIEEALHHGRPVDDALVADGGCSIVFRPGTKDVGPQMSRINRPTKTVLGLCDGCRTVAEIVAATETALGATDLNDPVVETINRLLASHVLVVEREGAAQAPAPLWPYSGAAQGESM